jgi:2-keto-4-pentenoate hydratase/2-oxohepta-3-ene-1,7-dioic acid hydratase in catechol pathway
VYYGPDKKPVYGPSQELDYELEMGYFVSKPVEYGTELNIKDAEDHIFGFVLLNDWSSRDLQIFEMKPLGPFHGKGEISLCLWRSQNDSSINNGLTFGYRIRHLNITLGRDFGCTE